jgi:pimeloyl-ACP methyl ester carboxylesterase
MRKLITNISLLVIIAYISAAAYLYVYQRKIVYNPPIETLHPVSSYSLGQAEDVEIETQDGIRLHAWYHEPNTNCGKLILYFHGNSGILADRKEKLDKLRELGYGFLIPAWRGYGKSEGFPYREGILHDAHAAIKFLKDKGYDLNTQVLLIGESLGSGIASEIALEYQFHGLMLLGAYTSIADMGQYRYPLLPVKPLLTENFSTISNLEQVNIPVLIMHGKRDYIIPVKFAPEIFAAANNPKKLVIYDDVRHTDFNNALIFDEMESFFGWRCSSNIPKVEKSESNNN